MCVNFTQATLLPSDLANDVSSSFRNRILWNCSLQIHYRALLPNLSWIHLLDLGNLISMKMNLRHIPCKHASLLPSVWNLYLLNASLTGALARDGGAVGNKSQCEHKALNMAVTEPAGIRQSLKWMLGLPKAHASLSAASRENIPSVQHRDHHSPHRGKDHRLF